MAYKPDGYPTNRVFIPSSRTEIAEDGKRSLGPNARRRGERAAHHYFKHRTAFEAAGAFILCSGGFGKSGAGQTAPQNRAEREGHLLADYLRDYWGIPPTLIKIEDESTSALSNVARSVQDGWIKPDEYDERHRLGVVAPALYQRRLVISLGKVGIPKAAIEPLCDEEEMSWKTELVGRMLTRTLTLGVSQPRGLLIAERLFDHLPIAGHSQNQI